MKKLIKSLLHQICKAEFWILLGLLLFTLFNRYPLLANMGSHTYYAGADYYIFTWILAWNCHALETFNIAHYWAGNAMYPYPYTLAFSENLLGVTPFAFPLWLASHNPILTINLTMLLLLWFSSISAYFVFRKMIGNNISALIGALIFAFYPYNLRSFTIGHPHMLSLLWIPIIVYANWMFWRENKWKHWIMMVFFWFWSFLMSLYLGIFMTNMLTLWNALWLLYERNLFLFKKILKWCIGVMIVWLLMAPVFFIYYQVTKDMGVTRTLENQTQYTGYIWSWLAVAEDNWLWGQQLNILPPSRFASREDAMFPGLITLVLFVASFLIKNMPGWLKSLRWTGIAMGVFAIGPFALGLPWKIPLPYSALWYIFPPLAATRNPHRWSFFVIFTIALIASWVIKNLPYAPSKKLAISIVVIMALCIELFTYTVPREALSPQAAGFYKALKIPGENHITVELPMAAGWYNWMDETRPLVASTYHWNTIVNGISGLWPPVQYQLGRTLKEFPSTHTIRLLQSLAVDTLIIHEDKYGDDLPAFLREMKTRKELTFVSRTITPAQNTFSVWHLDKGTLMETFNPDTDFRLVGPSQLVEGTVGLGIEITPACKKILFNPKAPAFWKAPMSRPWVINPRGLNQDKQDSSEEWFAPGLFHPRVCIKSFTATASRGDRVLKTEISFLDKKIQLTKNYKVVPAQKSPVPLPPFLRLPEGYTVVPLGQVKPKMKSKFRYYKTVQPGDVLEGDIDIINPGPYYWATQVKNGFPITTVLECENNRSSSRVRLPHDLFPGDSTTLHILTHIPIENNQCRLLLRFFTTPESAQLTPYSVEIWQMNFPINYLTQKVEFKNGNITLRGTLLVPHKLDTNKVIIFAHGFSRLGKDHVLYREIAQRFAQKGYMVLSFDFRGFNQSDAPAEIKSATDLDFTSDALSAVEYLRHHYTSIDSIIIAGHSFGAGVSVRAGMKSPLISKIVSIAPGRRTKELIFGKNPSVGPWWIQDRMKKDMHLPAEVPANLINPVYEPITIDYYKNSVFTKPILFVDGALEDIKDREFLKAYIQSINAKSKSYITIPDATHWFGTTITSQVIDSSIIQNLVNEIDIWLNNKHEK